MLFNNHIYDTYQSKCFLSHTESFSLHRNITVNETSITSICTDTTKLKTIVFNQSKITLLNVNMILWNWDLKVAFSWLLMSFFGSDKALGGFHGFGWKKHQHVQWEHAFLIIELFKITSTQVLFNASNSAKTQFMLEQPSFLLQFEEVWWLRMSSMEPVPSGEENGTVIQVMQGPVGCRSCENTPSLSNVCLNMYLL